MHAFFHCEYSCTYMYILKHIVIFISTLLFSKAVGPHTNCMLLRLLQQHEIHMYSTCTFAQVLKKGIGIYLQFCTTGALKEVNYLLPRLSPSTCTIIVYTCSCIERVLDTYKYVSGQPSIEARHLHWWLCLSRQWGWLPLRFGIAC